MIFPSLNKFYHSNVWNLFMCRVISTGVITVSYIAYAWMWFVLYVGLKCIICVCLICVIDLCVWWKYNCLCAKLGKSCDLGIDCGDMLSSHTHPDWWVWPELIRYKICSMFLARSRCSVNTDFLPFYPLTWYFNFDFDKTNMTSAHQLSPLPGFL